MKRTTTRQPSAWARWTSWTAAFTLILSVWGFSLFWPHNPLRVLSNGVLFWPVILGLAALAFGIGVRLAEWSWVAGVLIASMLQFLIVAPYGLPWRPETGQDGLVLLLLLPVYLLFMLPAAAGVRWAKRRQHEVAIPDGDPADDDSRPGQS